MTLFVCVIAQVLLFPDAGTPVNEDICSKLLKVGCHLWEYVAVEYHMSFVVSVYSSSLFTVWDMQDGLLSVRRLVGTNLQGD